MKEELSAKREEKSEWTDKTQMSITDVINEELKKDKNWKLGQGWIVQLDNDEITFGK